MNTPGVLCKWSGENWRLGHGSFLNSRHRPPTQEAPLVRYFHARKDYNPDRVRSESQNDRLTIHFHFDH
jgi:hypothetical protein